MVKNGNYITIIGWMRKLLNLSLEEMVVYAIIYGFSQDRSSSFDMSVPYLVEWTGKSERTIRDILDRLEKKGVINAEARTGKSTLYKAVPLQDIEKRNEDTPANSAPLQILHPCKNCTPANSAPLPLQNLQDKYITNNNISNTNLKVVVVESASEPAPTCTQATTAIFLSELFEKWWLTYGMPEYEGEKEECKRYWFGYSETDRNKVISHTELFAPINLAKNPKSRKHPYWYLKDKYYLNDLSTMTNTDIPILTGSEADLAKKNGEEVWNCKLPDGKFGLVMKKDADKFGLELNWKL